MASADKAGLTAAAEQPEILLFSGTLTKVDGAHLKIEMDTVDPRELQVTRNPRRA